MLVSVSVENFDSFSGSSEIKREFGREDEEGREDCDKTEDYSRPLRAIQCIFLFASIQREIL